MEGTNRNTGSIHFLIEYTGLNLPMPLSIGDKLGPYEILASIGAGGMGQVWKARDTRLDRIVAIQTSAAQFSDRFGFHT